MAGRGGSISWDYPDVSSTPNIRRDTCKRCDINICIIFSVDEDGEEDADIYVTPFRNVFEPIRGAWNIPIALSMLIDAFLIAEVLKSQYPCCAAHTLFALYVRSVTSEK